MKKNPIHSSLFVPPSNQDHIQGVLSATVVLVMYGDYQCHQSANAYRLINTIQREVSRFIGEKTLCFVFRHFPQAKIHPHAQHAAEAAEAASNQGQFWQMHEVLFEHSQSLGDGCLVEYANDLGLDISQFLRELSKHIYVNRTLRDIESGYRSGVTVAPALFVNGIPYHEYWTVNHLTAAIINAAN